MLLKGQGPQTEFSQTVPGQNGCKKAMSTCRECGQGGHWQVILAVPERETRHTSHHDGRKSWTI